MPNKVSTLNITYPIDCEIVRKIRTEYADWIYLIEHGYIRYYKSDGKKLLRKYEHQLVAQSTIGESSKKLHVHHKNENKLDNRAVNLTLLNTSEHQKIHHPRIEAACTFCGKQVMIVSSRLRNDKTYCNQACYRASTRKVQRPTKEELLDMITSTGNWCAIGRIFGVTDNAVRKWARNYQLI